MTPTHSTAGGRMACNEDRRCGSCAHIGQAYWGDTSDYGGRTHFCKKSNERRRDTMKPTGDFAEDFMSNFRTFFDAKACNPACKYYEERGLTTDANLKILVEMAANGGKSAFGFFSEENSLCERMNRLFVEQDHWARNRRKPTDGTRDWLLTHVGKSEIGRAALKTAAGEK